MNRLACIVVREHRVSAVAMALLRAYFEEVGVVLTDTAEALGAMLCDDRTGLWLARFNGEAIGCVLLRPLEEVPQAAECKRLYVRPAFRGRGVASALLETMEAFAVEAGWNAIYLDSKDDLAAAVALYRQRGYEPCPRYNSNPQATKFFRKLL